MGKQDKSPVRYEIRVIRESIYNSHADITDWYFTNGRHSATSPAGHSDQRNFPDNTVVLCRLREDQSKGEKGYFLEGFAKVVKFSKTGRPIEFADSLSNARVGQWIPPTEKEVIHDERKRRKPKKIR